MVSLGYIIKGVNKLVSNNSSYPLNYNQLMLYLDTTVDFINSTLGTSFKTISESGYATSIAPDTYMYGEIPDKYIRQVLIYYTASLYLEEEDETEDQYKLYQTRALEALRVWKKEQYSCYDVTDNDYDYSRVGSYDNVFNNAINTREDVYSLISKYKDYLDVLKASGKTDIGTLDLIDRLEQVIAELNAGGHNV